ncbi:MAG TPA: iron-containing redox enzyme family protein [Acidimicrobiales bacterium]|nr:iron-containing redox enzyme family protein [Acidimicrobiales bacterium]
MKAAGPGAQTPARRLPRPRGPLSEYLVERLRWRPHDLAAVPEVDLSSIDPLVDDDLHLALYLCYELHYRGWAGVQEGWEWEPTLLAFRRRLESAFLGALMKDVGPPERVDPAVVEDELHRILGSGTGPSLSSYMSEKGTVEQFREFCVHRSAYQLKEADPHTWAIPRLDGAAKAALVLIQSDEYGNGIPEDVHAERFAVTMESLGLDRTYGAYLDHVPGVTLATVNLISLFGLHRQWRGALVGHLAIFEMASVVPMGRYAAALRRLGFGPEATDFYDVHVEADEIHQVVAARDLAAGFAAQEPDRAGDILFGARAIMKVEERFATALHEAWTSGRKSLRLPLAPLVVRAPARVATCLA